MLLVMAWPARNKTRSGQAPRFGNSIWNSAPPRPDCLFGFDMAGGRHFRHLRLGHRADIELLAQLAVDFAEGVPVLLQEAARILAPLADALATVAVPRARLFHQVVGHRQVQ